MAVPLEEAVALVCDQLRTGARALALHALPGYGKSALLTAVGASLTRSGRPVLHVSFPAGDDAALAALIDTAAGLEGRTAGLLDRVVPPDAGARGAWRQRIAPVREALVHAPEELVVLLDEPWLGERVEPGEELFADRATELTKMLLQDHHGAVVLASSAAPPATFRDAGVQLPLTRDVAKAPHLLAVSPVVKQILAALRAGGVDVGAIPRRDLRPERLIEHDLGRLCRDSASLRRMMARLAAPRVPFTEAWLTHSNFAALAEVEQRVVEALLWSPREGFQELPPAIAAVIRAQIGTGDPFWVPDEPAGEAHREAARYHRARHALLRDCGDAAGAIREELEEIHHLTEAGDAAELLDRSLQFVEQYDALGRSLSLQARRAEPRAEERLRLDAVRAYERALAHDPEDAYAHHYIAYNLDILGMAPERVDREFVAARDLAPSHPWYHGRYVCFLITRGRMGDARAAWEQASLDLEHIASARPPSLIWKELHGPVARHLLSRAQLAFAGEVLEDVPREARDAPWWRALERLRVHLEEDRDERLVFPLGVALEERWEGPHLVTEDPDGPGVTRWRPGRVVAAEDGAVILHVVERAPPGPEKIRTLRLPVQTLRERWGWSARPPSPGTFVELIEYEDGGAELKSWERDASRFAAVPGLPGLFPYPDRYIRRAFA